MTKVRVECVCAGAPNLASVNVSAAAVHAARLDLVTLHFWHLSRAGQVLPNQGAWLLLGGLLEILYLSMACKGGRLAEAAWKESRTIIIWLGGWAEY